MRPRSRGPVKLRRCCAIKTIVDSDQARTSPFSLVVIQHVHGAASRVGPTETAFVQSELPYALETMALSAQADLT